MGARRLLGLVPLPASPTHPVRAECSVTPDLAARGPTQGAKLQAVVKALLACADGCIDLAVCPPKPSRPTRPRRAVEGHYVGGVEVVGKTKVEPTCR